MEIFGVSLSENSKKEVRESIRQSLEKKSPLRIVTVNPEYLLLARENKRFRKSINQASLKVVDGFGIVFFAWLRGKKVERCTGADFVTEILSEAQRQAVPVVFLLHPQGLSSEEEVKKIMQKHWPQLRFQFQASKEFSVVVCNFGAPSQEFLLDEYPIPGIKIGVGGAIDFLTGKQKRAPRFLRSIGLEWLFRLIQQPKRWRRIWNAVVIFPILVILEKK